MAMDQVFWKAILRSLREWVFGLSGISYTIEAPKQADFPPASTDFGGAYLFDANFWKEEVTVLLQHKQKSPSEDSSSNEINFVHSCLLLPADLAIFNPVCPVIQTQAHYQVHEAVELAATDVAIWQPGSEGLPVYTWTDAFRPAFLSSLPVPSFLSLVVLVACLCSCWFTYVASKSKRALEDTILQQASVLRRIQSIIDAKDGELGETQEVIEGLQAGLDAQAKELADKEAIIANLKATFEQRAKEEETDRDTEAKELADKEALIANLKAALEQRAMEEEVGRDRQAKELAQKEASIANLKAALEQKEEEEEAVRETAAKVLAQKEAFIADLEASLARKEEEWDAGRETQAKALAEKEALIANLKASLEQKEEEWGAGQETQAEALAEKEALIANLKASLKQKEEEWGAGREVQASELAEKEATIANLKAALEGAEKEAVSANLKVTLAQDKSAKLVDVTNALEGTIRGRDTKIGGLESALEEARSAIAGKDDKLREQEKAVQALKLAVASKAKEVNSQKSSLGALSLSVEEKDREIKQQETAIGALTLLLEEAEKAQRDLERQLEQVKEEQLQVQTAFAEPGQQNVGDADELAPSFAQTVGPMALPQTEVLPLSPAPVPVPCTFEEEVDTSFTNTAAELDFSPTTPVVEAVTPPVRVSWPAVAPAPAPAPSPTPASASVTPGVPKVKNKGNGAGDLLLSKYATPAAAAPAPPAPPARVFPPSVAASAVESPLGSRGQKDTREHIFFEPKVKNLGHGPGDLLASKYATLPPPPPPAKSARAASTAITPSPAPSAPSRPKVEKDTREHIFFEPKVKHMGQGPGDLLASKYATVPAAAVVPTAPSGPSPPPPSSGPKRSGSVESRAAKASHAPSALGVPTRPKTKVERVIDSQTTARGLPELTPNRPKTQAERAAEAAAKAAAK